jgi:hypothetical protein
MAWRPGFTLAPSSGAPLGDLPPGIPAHYPRADRYLNDAVLVAEALGIPTLAATTTFERLADQGDSARYDELDAEVLARFAAEMAAVLDQAVDEDGRPRGPLGEQLAAAECVERWDDRLVLRWGHETLADLRAELPELAAFLRHAADQRLHLVVEEAYQ